MGKAEGRNAAEAYTFGGGNTQDGNAAKSEGSGAEGEFAKDGESSGILMY